MRGATAPRLQLELICARVLLPGADDTDRGVAARLDRMERRLAMASVPSSPPTQPPPTQAQPTSSQPTQPQPTQPVAERPAVEQPPVSVTPPAVSAEPAAASSPPASEQPASEQQPAAVGPTGIDLPGIRRMWPEILDEVKRHRRYSWMILLDNAQIAALDGRVLTVAFSSEGAKRAFTQSGSPDILQLALIEKLGVDWQVETIIDPGRRAAASTPDATVAASSGSSGRQAAPSLIADEEVSADDELVGDGESGADLVQRMLGARKIGESRRADGRCRSARIVLDHQLLVTDHRNLSSLWPADELCGRLGRFTSRYGTGAAGAPRSLQLCGSPPTIWRSSWRPSTCAPCRLPTGCGRGFSWPDGSYAAATPDLLADVEAGLLEHMVSEHADEVATLTLLIPVDLRRVADRVVPVRLDRVWPGTAADSGQRDGPGRTTALRCAYLLSAGAAATDARPARPLPADG